MQSHDTGLAGSNLFDFRNNAQKNLLMRIPHSYRTR